MQPARTTNRSASLERIGEYNEPVDEKTNRTLTGSMREIQKPRINADFRGSANSLPAVVIRYSLEFRPWAEIEQ